MFDEAITARINTVTKSNANGTMEEYYREGEEKFGMLLSFFYWMGGKLPQINNFYKFVVSDLERSKSRAVLDVGTGPGYVPTMLAQKRHMESIYGVDPSKWMIKIANFRAGGSKVTFGLGSSRRIPFKRKFDIIVSTLSFHHWKGQADSLRYLKRFLDKGGEIRIYELEKGRSNSMAKYVASNHSVSLDEVERIAKMSGLKVKGVLRSKGFIRISLA